MQGRTADRLSISRALTLLFAALAFVFALSLGLVRLVLPQPPPASVQVGSPLGPPLTAHLVFVIIDGLRYDVGVDPSRMPNFSRRMATYASAESWANPISMTSAAVLTFATGQRATVEQIVTNESGREVNYNSFMKNAKDAGLVTAAAGERAWFRGFPDAWTMRHPDPYGVAIDVDYNDEIFAATDEFLTKRPALLVAHFVTPDHQAHAYGVLSERYRAHIRAFDKRLEKLLAGLPADTTVIITSDHGMTDAGTHGSDTPLQRRSPFVAYGPGIAPRGGASGVPPPASQIDQIDVSGTMAALLGVAPPAHGRGHILVDWLDISEEERARLACADLARLRAYAAASTGRSGALPRDNSSECEPTSRASPRERVVSASRAARVIDESLDHAAVGGLPLGWLVPIAGIVGALSLSFVALRSQAVSRAVAAAAAPVACATLVLGGLLTYSIELLPGRWPDVTRVALFALAHLAVIAAIRRPRAAAWLLDHRVIVGAALLPGALLITPPRITQVEAYVAAVLIGAIVSIVGVPRADADAPRSLRGAIREVTRALAPAERVRRWVRVGAVLALFGLVIPVGVREGDFLPSALVTSPPAALAAAMASIGLIALDRGARAWKAGDARSPRDAALGASLFVISLLLHRSAPVGVCLAAWLGLPAAALFAYVAHRRRALAELLMLASYAWVSRDAELPILAATLLIAGLVGDAFAESLKGRSARPSAILLVVTFLFAWTFVQRVGVELGLDFIHFDWGAGAFRELGAPMERIGAALAFKHGVARGAVIFIVLSALPRAHRAWVALGLFVTELFRAAALMTMLYLCRASFWTCLRVIGDLPHSLTALVVSALALLGVALTEARRRRGVGLGDAPLRLVGPVAPSDSPSSRRCSAPRGASPCPVFLLSRAPPLR